jgi:hypothetical protein
MATPDLVVSGQLPGEINLNTGCHSDSKSSNLSPPVCSPMEEAGKNVQTGFLVDLWSATGFLQRSTACQYGNSGGEKDKISFYTVNVHFSKIVAFIGTIRKFLNVAAVHFECLMHPLICIFDALFVSVSL